MPEEAPPPVADPPRPPAADRPIDLLGDRVRSLRADPRVGAVVLALVAVAAGLFWYRSGTAPAASTDGTPERTSSVETGPSAAATTSTEPTGSDFVVVHVAGAVAAPGLVTLPSGSRVADAVEAAGGPQPDADLDRLNLAAPVADGERVAVARRGEPPPPLDASPSGEAGSAAAGTGETAFPIDVNTATAADLEALPGIGPALAAAIVEERERRGGFTSVEELQQVPGIGERRFAQLRDLVTV